MGWNSCILPFPVLHKFIPYIWLSMGLRETNEPEESKLLFRAGKLMVWLLKLRLHA